MRKIFIIIIPILIIGCVQQAPKIDYSDQVFADWIKSNINEQYLPSSFSIKQTNSSSDSADSYFYEIGCGRRYADQHHLNWTVNGAYVVAIACDEKGYSNTLNEYMLVIATKNNDIQKNIALDFIKNIPDQNFKTTGPVYDHIGDQIKIFTKIWSQGPNKAYIKTFNEFYVSPIPSHVFPGNTSVVSDFSYQVYMPNNQLYGLVEEFEKSAHNALNGLE